MRLIDATELERVWEKHKARDQYNGGGYLYSPQDILDDIEEAPTIEAEPVKHGEWVIITDEFDCEMMECSCCGAEFYDGDNDTVDRLHNYCPSCGAKMDGGADHA